MEFEFRTGTSKKGYNWEAIQFVVGDWKSPLIFPSRFELDYLHKQLGE